MSLSIPSTILSPSNILHSNANISTDIDEDVRKTYFKTLQAMKTAHFKNYYEMQSSMKTTKGEIRLPRLFASFHPCPLKLMMLELCKKPLNVHCLPEVFEGLQMEFTQLYHQYQKLNAQTKNALLENLVEDTESDFDCVFNTFLKSLEQTPHSIKISLLLHTFEKDVIKSKKSMDFIIEIKRNSKSELPIHNLLFKTLSNIIKTGDASAH